MEQLLRTYKLFYKNRRIIREMYKCLNMRHKIVLKRYIYSNVLIKPYHKDLIWEYLNEELGSEYYVSNNKLKKEYRKAKI